MIPESVEHPRAAALDAATALSVLSPRDQEIVLARLVDGEGRSSLARRFAILDGAVVERIVTNAARRIRTAFPELNPALA